MFWGAVTTGGPEIPLWLWIVATAGVGFLAALVGSFPWVKDRRRHAEARQRHEDRMKATCDAVLGQDPDPNVGRFVRVPGLVDVIGHANGKTVMEHITDIERHIGMAK